MLLYLGDDRAWQAQCFGQAAPHPATQHAFCQTLQPSLCQVGALPEAELAARVRADRCDVLVELTGHTAGNRLDVLAMRPAPVQVFRGRFFVAGLELNITLMFCRSIGCCYPLGASRDECSPAELGQVCELLPARKPH